MKPLVFLAVISLAATTLIACEGGRDSGAIAQPKSGAPTALQKYACPMHPSYVMDRPGDCAVCGMKLVPIGGDGPKADVALTGHAAVQVDSERRRLVGLKTTAVRMGELAGVIRTVGRVTMDERRVAKVQPRFEGYIEKLDANYTGKFVRKGQRLASIYSPELLATEQELLLATRGRDALRLSGLGDAEEGPRTKLQLLGIGRRQIDEVVKKGKPLHALAVVAPITGFIITKNAMAGARVTNDQPLFEIADLRVLWLIADVYESELPRLALGQEATATLSYWPGRSWHGRVTYVYPTVDEKTRTVKVRIELPNPRGELRPEMFADVVIQSASRRALVVPEDAILDTGTRAIAFVDLAGGKLAPREVELGTHADGLYEVRGGLVEGEQVALGASFLLDSESRLKAAVSQMAAAPAGHQHGAAGSGHSHATEPPAPAPSSPPAPAPSSPPAPPPAPHAGHGGR